VWNPSLTINGHVPNLISAYAHHTDTHRSSNNFPKPSEHRITSSSFSRDFISISSCTCSVFDLSDLDPSVLPKYYQTLLQKLLYFFQIKRLSSISPIPSQFNTKQAPLRVPLGSDCRRISQKFGGKLEYIV
jgi:hypothetical protein